MTESTVDYYQFNKTNEQREKKNIHFIRFVVLSFTRSVD